MNQENQVTVKDKASKRPDKRANKICEKLNLSFSLLATDLDRLNKIILPIL